MNRKERRTLAVQNRRPAVRQCACCQPVGEKAARPSASPAGREHANAQRQEAAPDL